MSASTIVLSVLSAVVMVELLLYLVYRMLNMPLYFLLAVSTHGGSSSTSPILLHAVTGVHLHVEEMLHTNFTKGSVTPLTPQFIGGQHPYKLHKLRSVAVR